MSITAMRLALKALEHEAAVGNDDAYLVERTALRQAIAEAEQANPAANSNCELCGQWNSTLTDGVCRVCERKYK